MNDSKANILFTYLYRDAGNYKNCGAVFFGNPSLMPVQNAIEAIRKSLIDGEFFEHKKFGVPSLHFSELTADDHFWHEFENIQVTDETVTDSRVIEDFIEQISVTV